MANPKYCEICKNNYDGRKAKCPYCEDDAAYQRDRIRRRSTLEVEAILGTPTPSTSPPITLRTPIVQPTGGATATPRSPARDRLDQTLSELGDVSGIVAEFRSLSTALNRRMDGIERLMGEICDRLPVAGNASIQDGGERASGTTGTTATGGAPGAPGAAANGGAQATAGATATGDSIRFNFTGTTEHRFPPIIQVGGAGGRPLQAGIPATPAQEGRAVGNGAEPEVVDPNQPPALSKFDLRRFLPTADRKKPLSIDSNEKLFYLLSRLLDDMGRKGFDVVGLVSHISYLTWMAATGIYTTEALSGYDYEMRERARQEGMGAFTGGDTSLTNMYLGASGTKQFKAQQQGGQGRYNNSNNNNYRAGSSYGARPTNHTGWRAAASRRGICFSHAQSQPCTTNCRYRHECTCGSADHNMLNCPSRRRDQGGDTGGRGGTA